jgi:hypothetical protein
MNPLDGGYRIPEEVLTNAPLELGINAPFFQVISLTLDAARGDEEIIFSGNFVWAYDASDLEAVVNIKFNNQLSTALPFYRGQVVKGQPFSRLFITHDAQAGKTIELLVVRQSGEFSIENPGSLFNAVTVTKASNAWSGADVTIVAAAASAVILAADATRVSAIVTALSTNTQEVRIGLNIAATAAKGIPLSPGESVSIDGTAAIYGYTGAGADQVVAISVTQD